MGWHDWKENRGFDSNFRTIKKINIRNEEGHIVLDTFEIRIQKKSRSEMHFLLLWEIRN